MNHLIKDFTSIEEGIIALKKLVAIRDKMGGSLYWNVMNDDCCKMARKIAAMGADKEELSQILGKETHIL